MTDINEFNIRLGKAMGADHVGVGPNGKVHATWNPKPGFKWPTGKEIDYRDPAICLENARWLLDEKLQLRKEGEYYKIVDLSDRPFILIKGMDKDLCKAVALARIEVSDGR